MTDLNARKEAILRGERVDISDLLDGSLFLIGFMGVGKSTVSAALERLCGLTVLEMDAEIERRAGMKISDIFAQQGEPAFRQMETDLITTLPSDRQFVVSCGGGTPMRQVNVDAMRSRGKILWLTAAPETILSRVADSHDRPLLEGHKDVDFIANLLNQRSPKYAAAADLTVATDGRTAEELCCDILTALWNQKEGR